MEFLFRHDMQNFKKTKNNTGHMILKVQYYPIFKYLFFNPVDFIILDLCLMPYRLLFTPVHEQIL